MAPNGKNIIIKCPGCSAKLAIPDSACGKKVRCTKCKKVLQVPETKKAAKLPPIPQLRSAPQPITSTPPPVKTAAPPSPEKKEKKKVTRLKVGKITQLSDVDGANGAVSIEEAEVIKELAEQRRKEINRLRQIDKGLVTNNDDETNKGELPNKSSLLKLKNIAIAAITVFLTSTIYFVFIDPPQQVYLPYSADSNDKKDNTASITSKPKQKESPEEAAKRKEAERIRKKKLFLYGKYSCSKVKLNPENNLIGIEYDFRAPRDINSWQPATRTTVTTNGNLILKGTNNEGTFIFQPKLSTPFSIALFMKSNSGANNNVNISIHRIRNRKLPMESIGKGMSLRFCSKQTRKDHENNLSLYEVTSSSRFARSIQGLIRSFHHTPLGKASYNGFPFTKGCPVIIRSKGDGYPMVKVDSTVVRWTDEELVQDSIVRPEDKINNIGEDDEEANDSADEAAEEKVEPFFETAQLIISFSGISHIEISKMALKIPYE